MAPTGRTLILGGAGLVLALFPTLVASELWLLWLAACLLLAAAVAADAALCPRPSQLAAEVELPAELVVDEAEEAVVRLALPLGRPVAAAVTLDLGPRLEPAAERFPDLAAEPVEVRLALRPRRRGPAMVEALWVRFDGPLGLVRRTVRRPLGRRLRILPNVRFARGRGLGSVHQPRAAVGRKIENYSGEGSEFHALREFRAGLDPRSIDWKASARHTRLLSREVRAERNHRIVLGLDTGRLMAEPLGGVPLLDHALHAALALAFVSLRHGDRVGLYSFAGRPGALLAPRPGMAAFRALVRRAGELRYSGEETNFTLGLTDLAGRLRRRSLVVVFTDFVDSISGELMVANLLRLRRRHLVLFVALRDPALGELVDAEPRSCADLDRAVVAGALLREREVILERLRKAGVFALDAPPAAARPRLVDRYLEIKRREMI